jgi:hypothetical protein
MLAGAGAFTDIARFGEKKIDLPRRFRPHADAGSSPQHLRHAREPRDGRMTFTRIPSAVEARFAPHKG